MFYLFFFVLPLVRLWNTNKQKWSWADDENKFFGFSAAFTVLFFFFFILSHWLLLLVVSELRQKGKKEVERGHREESEREENRNAKRFVCLFYGWIFFNFQLPFSRFDFHWIPFFICGPFFRTFTPLVSLIFVLSVDFVGISNAGTLEMNTKKMFMQIDSVRTCESAKWIFLFLSFTVFKELLKFLQFFF